MMTIYNGPWTYDECAHLLKRTMFGATTQDVEHFLSMPPGQAVDELLSPRRSVSPPLRDYGSIDHLGSMVNDSSTATGETWINDFNKTEHVTVRPTINNLRIESLRKWWAGLIIHQERSIEEKMVLFWHHHFSVQREEVNNANYLYWHHMLLRNNFLGNIRELTKKVTIDQAMLVHLNGFLNSKRAPDENYARELQELFTVGKGNDSHYTESDVQEAARVLTGWRINPDTLQPYLEVSQHDTGTKKFSSFYNNTTIAGSNDGTSELNSLIDMIFNNPETAKFICRKLYKWFVYYDISNTVEAEVIGPMAQLLRDSNFETAPVIAALLKSEHFYDKRNRACHIKAPYDFMVGTIREFGISFPSYTDHVNGYPLFYAIYNKAAEMQQDLFQPPDVSGWPSYYQDPMHYELWVNSNTLPRRAAFTDQLIDEQIADVQAFVSRVAGDPSSVTLVEDLTRALLRYPLTDSSKSYIKDHFANNMPGMLKFIMNLPEYHLC